MKILFIKVFVLTSLVCITQASFSQNFELNLESSLILGEENSDSTQYMFGNIRLIKSDEDGFIYVADGSDNSIRVFDKNGNFSHQMGGRGRGPGEFSEISYFELSQDNMIIAIDRYQARVTFFNSDGTLFKTSLLKIKNLSNAQYIFQNIDNDSFYIVYRDYQNEDDQGYLLHLFDHTFEHELDRSLSVFDNFYDSSVPFEKRISIIPYLATRFGEHNIAIVPRMYTGTIATLNLENSVETLIGKPIDDPYKIYDWENRDRYFNSDEKGFSSISGRSGSYVYRSKGGNFGLIGNNRFLLKFYGINVGKEVNPHVDIFSSEGKLLSSVSLKDIGISFIKNGRFSIIPIYLDDDNNLYLSDYSYQNSYPAVRVFETNLGELIE